MSHENKEYLAWVRTMPCIRCGKPGEPHHVIGIGLGTMGGKASDIHTMPLCREHHDELHLEMSQLDKALYQLRWIVRTQETAISMGLL